MTSIFGTGGVAAPPGNELSIGGGVLPPADQPRMGNLGAGITQAGQAIGGALSELGVMAGKARMSQLVARGQIDALKGLAALQETIRKSPADQGDAIFQEGAQNIRSSVLEPVQNPTVRDELANFMDEQFIRTGVQVRDFNVRRLSGEAQAATSELIDTLRGQIFEGYIPLGEARRMLTSYLDKNNLLIDPEQRVAIESAANQEFSRNYYEYALVLDPTGKAAVEFIEVELEAGRMEPSQGAALKRQAVQAGVMAAHATAQGMQENVKDIVGSAKNTGDLDLAEQQLEALGMTADILSRTVDGSARSAYLQAANDADIAREGIGDAVSDVARINFVMSNLDKVTTSTEIPANPDAWKAWIAQNDRPGALPIIAGAIASLVHDRGFAVTDPLHDVIGQRLLSGPVGTADAVRSLMAIHAVDPKLARTMGTFDGDLGEIGWQGLVAAMHPYHDDNGDLAQRPIDEIAKTFGTQEARNLIPSLNDIYGGGNLTDDEIDPAKAVSPSAYLSEMSGFTKEIRDMFLIGDQFPDRPAALTPIQLAEFRALWTYHQLKTVGKTPFASEADMVKFLSDEGKKSAASKAASNLRVRKVSTADEIQFLPMGMVSHTENPLPKIQAVVDALDTHLPGDAKVRAASAFESGGAMYMPVAEPLGVYGFIQVLPRSTAKLDELTTQFVSGRLLTAEVESEMQMVVRPAMLGINRQGEEIIVRPEGLVEQPVLPPAPPNINPIGSLIVQAEEGSPFAEVNNQIYRRLSAVMQNLPASDLSVDLDLVWDGASQFVPPNKRQAVFNRAIEHWLASENSVMPWQDPSGNLTPAFQAFFIGYWKDNLGYPAYDPPATLPTNGDTSQSGPPR
jgi:hypothetical protein